MYEVEGGRELRRTLRKAGDDLQDLKTAHAQAGAIVSATAVHTAPFIPGSHLLASTVRFSATKNAALIRAGNNKPKGNPDRVPYAGPIHFGWPQRRIPANPWITEAAQSTEPSWAPIYERARDKALEKVKGI